MPDKNEDAGGSELLALFVASALNRLLKAHTKDISSSKVHIGITEFLKTFHQIAAQYVARHKPRHFPSKAEDISINRIVGLITTDARFSRFVSIINNSLIVEIVPGAYERWINDIVLTSTQQYSKLLLKYVNDLLHIYHVEKAATQGKSKESVALEVADNTSDGFTVIEEKKTDKLDVIPEEQATAEVEQKGDGNEPTNANTDSKNNNSDVEMNDASQEESAEKEATSKDEDIEMADVTSKTDLTEDVASEHKEGSTNNAGEETSESIDIVPAETNGESSVEELQSIELKDEHAIDQEAGSSVQSIVEKSDAEGKPDNEEQDGDDDGSEADGFKEDDGAVEDENVITSAKTNLQESKEDEAKEDIISIDTGNKDAAQETSVVGERIEEKENKEDTENADEDEEEEENVEIEESAIKEDDEDAAEELVEEEKEVEEQQEREDQEEEEEEDQEEEVEEKEETIEVDNDLEQVEAKQEVDDSDDNVDVAELEVDEEKELDIENKDKDIAAELAFKGEPENLKGKTAQSEVAEESSSKEKEDEEVAATAGESSEEGESPASESRETSEEPSETSSKNAVETEEPSGEEEEDDEENGKDGRLLVHEALRGSSRKRSRSPSGAASQHKRFQNIAVNLINSIQEHRFSSPFLLPVSKKDAPDYNDVIYEPKDLKNILKAIKLKQDPPAYSEIKQLERDIILMFANCIMFNRSDEDLVSLTLSMKSDVNKMFKLFEEAEEDIK